MMFVLQRGKKDGSDNKLNSNSAFLDQQVLRNQIHHSASQQHQHPGQAVPKSCHPRKGKTYSGEPLWLRRAAWRGWSPHPAACTGPGQKSQLLSLPAMAFCVPVLSRANQPNSQAAQAGLVSLLCPRGWFVPQTWGSVTTQLVFIL